MTDSIPSTNSMNVTLIADFACPWCRLGMANLDAALAEWTGAPVSVTYLPFFLDPGLAPEGANFRDHLGRKYPGVPLDAMFERVSQAGQSAGLEFRWDLVEKSPNTTLAHQLIFIAPDAKRHELAESIYEAYFLQGKDITQVDTLIDLAAAAGLDRDETRTRLLAGEGAEEVHSIARQVSQQGVTGVPFFIIDGRFALSGAQPPSAILEAIRQAAEPALSPAD